MQHKYFQYSYSKTSIILALLISLIACCFLLFLMLNLYLSPAETSNTALLTLSPIMLIFLILLTGSSYLFSSIKKNQRHEIVVTSKDVIFPKIPFRKEKTIPLNHIDDLFSISVRGSTNVTIVTKNYKFTYNQDFFDTPDVAKEFYEILLSHIKKA